MLVRGSPLLLKPIKFVLLIETFTIDCLPLISGVRESVKPNSACFVTRVLSFFGA